MNAPAEGYTELSAATSILAVALRTDPSLDFINDIAIEDNIKKLLNRLGISIENFTTILNSLHTDIVIELACILLDCAISEDRIALNFMRWFRDHQAVMPFLGYTDENGKFVLIRLADEVENCKFKPCSYPEVVLYAIFSKKLYCL